MIVKDFLSKQEIYLEFHKEQIFMKSAIGYAGFDYMRQSRSNICPIQC